MYLIPCQGENKPILLKIGNQGVVFYSHGWLDPASAGGGDECFKFMTSWGGGEGRVLLYPGFSLGPFRAFGKSRDSETRAKRRAGRACNGERPLCCAQCAGRRATNELLLLLQQMSWLIATGNLCLFSFSPQIANSKRAPLTWSWQKL